MRWKPLALQVMAIAGAAAGLFAQPPDALVPLRFETVGPSVSPPPATVMPPDAYSLSIDGDFSLGGFVFKDGYPLLHTDGGATGGNTALGLDALVSSTPGVPHSYSGRGNTAVGAEALRHNTAGFGNTASGIDALRNNTEGYRNTAIGSSTLVLNTTGFGNTATGALALNLNLMGSRNTADGALALLGNATGSANTAVGYAALWSNTYSGNTAVGALALSASIDGASNTALGYAALVGNVSGDGNVAAGHRALQLNETGSDNVAIGQSALSEGTTGSDNVAVGHLAGQYATGDDNIYLSNRGVAGESGSIRIGAEGTHTAAYVAGIVGRSVDPATAVAVRVDASGKLGTAPSSRRYKEQIRNMGEASAKVLELRPVRFRYKEMTAAGEQFGLIAEEVAEVLPELVVFRDGQPETVRYDSLAPMLLNEIQSLHRRVRELESRLARSEGGTASSQ